MYFFFQAEDGIRDDLVTGVQDVCSSDLGLVGVIGTWHGHSRIDMIDNN